jgi:hypothetical protein
MGRINLTAFTLGLALVATGASIPGRFDGTVSAQALNPCALLTTDEVDSLAPSKTSVAAGVASSVPAYGYMTCRYTWGTGVGRFNLDIAVADASRMFAGVSPDQVKQRLLESVKAETSDAVLSEIGEAAVFKPDSVAYATATALVKGRILQVHLGGLFAREKKDQIIGVLKAAAGRL